MKLTEDWGDAICSPCSCYQSGGRVLNTLNFRDFLQSSRFAAMLNEGRGSFGSKKVHERGGVGGW